MKYENLLKLSYESVQNYQSVYASRINNECATILNFEISGNKAFYLTNQEILLLITKITSLDKEISEKTKQLPEIALEQYTKQTLIDEIKQTNDIENVYSTKKEIKETFEKIDNKNSKGRFKGLISKYFKLQSGEDIPLKTCEDIRNLYDEIVLEEILEDDKNNAPDGEIFRKDSVSVYSDSGKEIHIGVYPEQRIISNLSSALLVLNDNKINYLISAAIFHYLFAYIHPFYDGNGRTDRFISSYYISKNLNSLVAYRFSYIIKKHTSKYYKMFSETNDQRNRGDLTPFIIQFLEFILEAEKELNNELEKRISQLFYFDEKIKEMNVSGLDLEIAFVLLQSALFDSEGLTANQISAFFGKSYNTIKKSLENLDEYKILRCESVGKKKLYDIDLTAFI